MHVRVLRLEDRPTDRANTRTIVRNQVICTTTTTVYNYTYGVCVCCVLLIRHFRSSIIKNYSLKKHATLNCRYFIRGPRAILPRNFKGCEPVPFRPLTFKRLVVRTRLTWLNRLQPVCLSGRGGFDVNQKKEGKGARARQERANIIS